MNSARYIIDVDDIERVKLFKWKFRKDTGYFQSRNPFNRKTVLLHRFICGADSFGGKCVVDHINRNKFDNRKSNLKITSFLFNNWNKGLDKRNKTGPTGVSKTKYGTYRVSIGVNKRNIELGTPKTFEKAQRIRKDAEKEYWGKVTG